MVKIKYLLIERIATDRLQIREKLDSDVVAEYAEVLAGGKKLPPVLVFFDGKTFFLADGFHRLQAARQLKISRIACEVREGSFEDAQWAACGANVDHGLRRTNADKRRAVAIALELRPTESSRTIAEHVGVVHRMVDLMRQVATVANSNVRNTRQSTGSVSASIPAGRIGRDGKLYPPVPMRHKKPAVAKASVEQPTDSAQGKSTVNSVASDGQTGGQSGGESADGSVDSEQADGGTEQTSSVNCKERGSNGSDETNDDGLLDSLGRHVPESLAPLWQRRHEIQEVLTAISRMRSAIRHAQESNDPLWAELNFSAALMHLDRAYTEVDATKPYVVCPMCQGIGCRSCKERGLLGKFRYDTVIPRELKVKAPQRGA